MASGKEIRTKIESIKKTQKITKAMELVAASKMRKAQDRMALMKAYAKKAMQVISHLANSNPEYKHPFTLVRDVKRVGFIIVSSDRGLCGGLNNGLFKQVLLKMRECSQKDITMELCVIGNKAASYFKRIGTNIVAHASHLGDDPSVNDLIGIIKIMLDKYSQGELDQVFICYNDFINTMKQEPVVQQILPLVHAEDESSKYTWDYIYEPDPIELLNMLLTRYIESQTYQAVVENLACEQAARMVAMKSATENAGELIEKLRLAYNKTRQATITREIAEIVSGAAAV